MGTAWESRPAKSRGWAAMAALYSREGRKGAGRPVQVAVTYFGIGLVWRGRQTEKNKASKEGEGWVCLGAIGVLAVVEYVEVSKQGEVHDGLPSRI